MRLISRERRSLEARLRGERRDYRTRFAPCWACRSSWKLTIHEILRGGSRGVALSEPCCWFVACWTCNSGDLNDATIWPVKRQLAVKHIEAGDLDLPRFCELKREAVTAYTMADLKNWIRRERKARAFRW